MTQMHGNLPFCFAFVSYGPDRFETFAALAFIRL